MPKQQPSCHCRGGPYKTCCNVAENEVERPRETTYQVLYTVPAGMIQTEEINLARAQKCFHCTPITQSY